MSMTPDEVARLYPEGRTFYYEGDNPEGFAAAVYALFGDRVETEVTVIVHCPPGLLVRLEKAFPGVLGT
jgi:hypothetical protein